MIGKLLGHSQVQTTVRYARQIGEKRSQPSVPGLWKGREPDQPPLRSSGVRYVRVEGGGSQDKPSQKLIFTPVRPPMPSFSDILFSSCQS